MHFQLPREPVLMNNCLPQWCWSQPKRCRSRASPGRWASTQHSPSPSGYAGTFILYRGNYYSTRIYYILYSARQIREKKIKVYLPFSLSSVFFLLFPSWEPFFLLAAIFLHSPPIEPWYFTKYIPLFCCRHYNLLLRVSFIAVKINQT